MVERAVRKASHEIDTAAGPNAACASDLAKVLESDKQSRLDGAA